MKRQPWTIHQLVEAHANDLAQCHNANERSCVDGMLNQSLRKAAETWAQRRNLTPGEIAILESRGISAPAPRLPRETCRKILDEL